MKNKFIILLISLFLLSSCSGFKLKRSQNSDEFLIEKKNPLVMPPDINDLPKPKQNIDIYDETDNVLIKNLENFRNEENQFIFHAGTKLVNKKYYSTGGRVLNFISLSETFKYAREKNLNLIREINWENGHYRNDIGHKVINS